MLTSTCSTDAAPLMMTSIIRLMRTSNDTANFNVITYNELAVHWICLNKFLKGKLQTADAHRTLSFARRSMSVMLAACLYGILICGVVCGVTEVELSQPLLEAVGGRPPRNNASVSVAYGSFMEDKHLVCHVPFPVYPISFSFPEEFFLHHGTVHKDRVVARVVPGMVHTYVHKKQSAYYRGYSAALFGMTWKKTGWDCMRHYEILASGALPYMPDVEDVPHGTMFRFPTELLEQIIRMPGVNHTAIVAKQFGEDLALINDSFDINQYEHFLNELMAHARRYLTTVSMADYLLQAAGFDAKSPLKVLFLAIDHVDYQAESLFHGLRILLGANAIDYPRRHWMYRKATEEEETLARPALYGNGFSYAFALQDIPIRRSKIEADILSRFYDVVIYGTAYITPLPLYETVSKVYSKDQVLFVDGSDGGAGHTDALYSKVCGKEGICFRRELVC